MTEKNGSGGGKDGHGEGDKPDGQGDTTQLPFAEGTLILDGPDSATTGTTVVPFRRPGVLGSGEDQPEPDGQAKPDGQPNSTAATPTPADDSRVLPTPADSDGQPDPQVPEKRGRGRPSLYKPEYCDAVISYMAEGHGLTAFAGSIGVSFKTVYQWRDDHAEFREATEIGLGLRLAGIEDTLNKPRSGPQVAGAIFTAKNIASHEYKDKIEHVHEGPSAESIQALKNALTEGAADAAKQLGLQLIETMRNVRVIDETPARGDIIDAVYEEIPNPVAGAAGSGVMTGAAGTTTGGTTDVNPTTNAFDGQGNATVTPPAVTSPDGNCPPAYPSDPSQPAAP